MVRVLPWVCLLTVTGCALRGPAFTTSARLEYNEAVQESGRRELLLNVVRLRYLEGPEFLSVGSIASQMSFDFGASLGGTFGDEQAVPSRFVTPGGEWGFSESPVATFTPRQDEAFTRRLVEPVALESLVALTRYGWSLERVLLVAVEEFGGVRNVATRETAAPADAAAGAQFAALARTLRALYEQRWLTLETVETWDAVAGAIPASAVTADDHLRAAASGYRFGDTAVPSEYSLERVVRRPVLRIGAEARTRSEVGALVAALGLSPAFGEYTLTERSDGVAGQIAVRTRSVLGAMAYLSQGVVVPTEDLSAGLAQASAPTAAVPLRIASARAEPAAAAIAVRHGGRWFYVDMDDFESRRTFGALESLLRLQLGAGTAADGPVLTLPIGR